VSRIWTRKSFFKAAGAVAKIGLILKPKQDGKAYTLEAYPNP